MKILKPQPFFFEKGQRAVLLLHGFTGNSADNRMLARYLEKKGYTCYAPIYKGHDASPEEMFQYGPDDWWQDVMDAYEFLREKGYEEIAVAGLSLGGVFSLKLGYTVPIKGIIPMCTPMYFQSKEKMLQGVLQFARDYKKREGKTPAQIEKEMEEFAAVPIKTLKEIWDLVAEVRENIDMIYAPTFVVQARHDTMIEPDSANIIYNEVESPVKELKWYEESGHVITLDKERDQLHEDVYQFLEKLDWQDADR